MNIQSASIATLRQLSSVIENLGQEHYSKIQPSLSGSSIGKHIRHVIEFYDCLLETKNEGVVNYDKRQRNLFLEQDPVLVVASIRSIILKIDQIEKDHSCKLEGTLVEDNSGFAVASSLYRELYYNLEHVIHHMAIVRMVILTNNIMIELPNDFGVAYSTVQHQKAICVQ